MSATEDRISEILDAGADPTPGAAEPLLAAQLLAVHGLLREREARASLPAQIERILLRTSRARPLFARFAGAAAVLLAAVTVVAVMLSEKALPSAEAMLALTERATAEAVERHYAVRRSAAGEPESPENHLFTWGSRWAIEYHGARGVIWFGGDGRENWAVGPLGRVFRPSDPGAFKAIQGEAGETLSFASLSTALARMKEGHTITVVGREPLPGRRGRFIHMRGVRKDPALEVSQADVWADEDTGVLYRIEMTIAAAGKPEARLVVDFVDASPKGEAFYTPEGHVK